MARIDYDIFCFDRVLSVEVSEKDKEKAAEIIDRACDEWQELDTDACCEEYILTQLDNAGIKYKYIEEE